MRTFEQFPPLINVTVPDKTRSLFIEIYEDTLLYQYPKTTTAYKEFGNSLKKSDVINSSPASPRVITYVT